MTSRKRPSWHQTETLERNLRDPLLWLGQYAAADRRCDAEGTRELHRQLVAIGYAVVREGAALPAGTLLATLTLADGTGYRLVQLERAEVTRLLREIGTPPGPSTP
jgi:hypothetical protein